MGKLLKHKWYILIFVAFVGISIWLKWSPQTKSDTEKTFKIRRQRLEESLSLSGEIKADEHIVLRFQSSGKLAWVGVKEGDHVQKGQPIANLDSRDLQKRLQRYLNTYMSARSDFDQRQDDNGEPDIWSLTDEQRSKARRLGDKAQNDLNNAVIDVELQNLALEYTHLVSPIDGIVVRADAPYAGVNITPSQAEFEIINPNTLYFSATADQTDVVNIHESQTGEIVFDAYPETKNFGVIDSISFTPKTGETGTTYEVKFRFDHYQDIYRLGMTGDVTLPLKEKNNVIAVPSTYIKSENGQKYVWINENGQRIKTYIKVGETFDTDTEVISGLKVGDVLYEK